MLKQESWEETLELLTADMDPHDIDVSLLTQRYREYIKELREFNLEVPAKAIRICAALLKIKAYTMNDETTEYHREEVEENPMDFEDGEEDVEELKLDTGPELDIPVKPRPKRRMELGELKTALRDAMEVKERREQRQEQREMIDHQFETEEETIREKINSLYSKVTDLVNGGGKVHFNQLLEQQTSEEKIEKFMQVLTLENDEKVTCVQEEFLGDLHVKPEDEKKPA